MHGDLEVKTAFFFQTLLTNSYSDTNRVIQTKCVNYVFWGFMLFFSVKYLEHSLRITVLFLHYDLVSCMEHVTYI